MFKGGCVPLRVLYFYHWLVNYIDVIQFLVYNTIIKFICNSFRYLCYVFCVDQMFCRIFLALRIEDMVLSMVG